MNTISLLDSVWNLPPDELLGLEKAIGNIRTLKEELIGQAGKSSEPPEQAQQQDMSASAPPQLLARARRPLPYPKPGSLRYSVHAALKGAHSPMPRADIIQAVSEERNVRVNQQLKAKIGDILTCGLDPHIRRVAYGIYRYEQ
jgi:hypothetical protein